MEYGRGMDDDAMEHGRGMDDTMEYGLDADDACCGAASEGKKTPEPPSPTAGGRKACEDDMPALNDARRCARMALVVDEVRQIARSLRDGTNGSLRTHISDGEFFVCGGRCVRGREYSFYRQLVYAKRDVVACVRRGWFPYAMMLKRATCLYMFHESDGEELDAAKNVSMKHAVAMPRIAFVLTRFRKFVRDMDAQNISMRSPEAAAAFSRIVLSKDEFVACGGYKTTSASACHSFYNQIVLACRDMRSIFERTRFCKAKTSFDGAEDEPISSEGEETEAVLMDGTKITYKAEENVDFIDINDGQGECASDDDWSQEDEDDL